MSVFVDTSALLAHLDADQPRHADVIDAWDRTVAEDRRLFTSNYVLVESFAVVQRRLGLDAARALADVLVPMLRPLWIDAELHAAAVAALFAASRRKLSFVDCTSFELMRRYGITDAFALDDDFARQGFGLLPSPLSPYARTAPPGSQRTGA